MSKYGTHYIPESYILLYNAAVTDITENVSMPDEKLRTIFVMRQNFFVYFFVIEVIIYTYTVLHIFLDNRWRKKDPNVERCYRCLYYIIIIVTIFHFFSPDSLFTGEQFNFDGRRRSLQRSTRRFRIGRARCAAAGRIHILLKYNIQLLPMCRFAYIGTYCNAFKYLVLWH